MRYMMKYEILGLVRLKQRPAAQPRSKQYANVGKTVEFGKNVFFISPFNVMLYGIFEFEWMRMKEKIKLKSRPRVG